MIAPSTPSPTRPRMATTSSSVDTPPEATTGRSVRAQTSRSSCEVRALEHAVLGDVGDDVAGAALGVEPRQRLPQVAALAGPAAGGQRGAAHVEADGHPVAVLGDGPGRPLGVLERGRAEVDPAAPGGQRPLEGLGVADAAAHLDLDVERPDDAGEQLGVGAAPERGVEVDEVQPLGALLLPGQGGLDRVAELSPGAGDALHELHGAALDDVDGGQQLQAGLLGRGGAHGWVLRGRRARESGAQVCRAGGRVSRSTRRDARRRVASSGASRMP